MTHDLLRFGGWFWVATALFFLASQCDRLILGRLLSLEMLGVYGIAFALSELPRGLMVAVSGNVIYPTYARLAAGGVEQLAVGVRRHRWPILIAMAAGLAVLVVVGDAVVHRLYDTRYAAAGWMLPLLAVGIWPNTLSQTADPALYALGRPRTVAYANSARLVFNLLAIPLGFALAGAPGAVLAVALNDVPFYVPVVYALRREGIRTLGQDVASTLLFAALLAALLLARAGLGFGSPFTGLGALP